LIVHPIHQGYDSKDLFHVPVRREINLTGQWRTVIVGYLVVGFAAYFIFTFGLTIGEVAFSRQPRIVMRQLPSL
jgi:hypothetical protein